MNIKILAKIGIISGSILMGGIIFILLLPFCINFFIDKYTPQIVGEINKITGLSAGLEDVKFVTTPNLSAGLKVKRFELYTPQKEPVFIADNFEVKMSLISILTKNLQINVIKLENGEITLKYNKNGDLDLLQYLPKEETDNNKNQEIQNSAALPFGLKLSNHLPNIHIGKYKVLITDGNDNYTLYGNKTNITDFIINKSIKLQGSGKVELKDREHFSFNINLLNKIMPQVELNDLVFNSSPSEEKNNQAKINIIEILRGLYDYNVTANADVDLKTSKNSINGKINVGNISIIDLPKSNADLIFKDNKININSNIYTAKNEISTIKGQFATGKNPYLDLNIKSDLDITNIINLTKKIALIFNIEDLQTLTASGNLNANFNIKSDLKNINSSGYLKIPTAKLYYGTYKIGLDDINANISMANNNIDIKNISLSILGQPLKIYGTLSSDAYADIHAIADKLNLKGLLIALGQASLMKENPVYSGSVSMDTIIKGKLDKINPIINLSIDNLDLKNIPSDLRLKAPTTKVNITSDGTNFSGEAQSSDVKLINPALTISAPIIKAGINPDVIDITPTAVSIDKNNTKISGKITNYLTEKISLDFVSTGDIKSTLKGDLNIAKQTMNLVFSTTELSTIIIPMFDKSKLSFKGKINIYNSMLNPNISGSASVPSISIPEIPVTMSDMDLKFNGNFLHGSGTVKEFATGGIKAQNLSSDFELKGMDFYLNNLSGTSFNGKVNGNILYNLSNANTKINFKGTGLDAESAIEGAAGIKNALSGTLDFYTNLTLTVLEYNQMLKSMKGNLSFNINKGAFGTIGRFEGFLGAANITQNYFLKNTVNALSNAAGLATTAQFNLLEGDMTFNDGWANLNSVKSAGPSLCYYITGKYNLVNGTTNVNILGRLDAPIVAKLGVLGTLNMSNIIGDKAANILKIITTNPNEENTSLIPALTNGSTNTQEFKVSFNGGVESKSSIKSFKWIKNADMSEQKSQTAKDIVNSVKEAYKTDINSVKEEWNNTVNAEKKKINNAKEQLNTTKDDFKNLWKSIKDSTKPAEKTASPTSSAVNSTETKTETIETKTTTPQQTEQASQKVENTQPTVKEQDNASSVQNTETKNTEAMSSKETEVKIDNE